MDIAIFKIADKEYGVDIKQVRHVIRMKEIVTIPDSADFVEGVISLRGKVIPLLNLRKKFSLKSENSKKENRIIITQIKEHLIGVLVDEVLNVANIEHGAITPPDKFLKDASYLTGVIKIGNRLILLIDFEKILSVDDETGIKNVHERVEVRKKNA
ncbi:MAG: chemotaxis protein CheW [Candidatus Omnitrophica bacterium]|nr:chemotaxis protein CheW [Candidatus Omnitrophota bacterium]